MNSKKPNELVIGLNNRDKRYFDVYKINLLDYSKELILQNNKFLNFIIDNDLKIRFGISMNQRGEKEYFEFKNSKWRLFMFINGEDDTIIHGFDETMANIYLTDNRNRNTMILESMNLESREIKILAEDSRVDVSILTTDPISNKIQAALINYDMPNYKILDSSIKNDIEYLTKLEKGKLTIISRTTNDKLWLVSYNNDNTPLKYYLYNRSDKKADYLFSSRKELEKFQLAPMLPVVITSRDKLDLLSYITYPVNTILHNKIYPTTPMPLVLYVHGGPWIRDLWGMNNIHQWLANRGYVVLSVNFRGSSGFGKKFLNAGNRQWGKKMQDDLTDAVNWAIANKIADPQRIAVMGGSYGGYAALAGLVFTPETFACGIDICGPSNLSTFINGSPDYWKPVFGHFKIKIGDWDTDKGREELMQVSPIRFASKIKKPLLIVHGANDSRVKQNESEQIVAEMRKFNIPVAYILYPDEGHRIVREKNRLSLYAITEQFLAKCFKEKAEPIGSDHSTLQFL